MPIYDKVIVTKTKSVSVCLYQTSKLKISVLNRTRARIFK